ARPGARANGTVRPPARSCPHLTTCRPPATHPASHAPSTDASAIIASMAASPITAVLVHSPFLGPASLRPLADALAAHGHPAVLPDLRPSVVSAPVHQVLVGAFADAMGEEALTGHVVLIGHSGAGPLLPAFADALEDTVTGLVFVDA